MRKLTTLIGCACAMTFAFSTFAYSEHYNAAEAEAAQLVAGYNDLINDIENWYPEQIAEHEEKIAAAEAELKEIEDYIKEQEDNGWSYDKDFYQTLLKQAKGKIRSLNVDLDRLKKDLESKKASLSEYEIGLKQKQDESFSTAVLTGNSVNSDHEGLDEYDETVIEYTDRFWIEDNDVVACYRYWDSNLLSNEWVYVPFVTPDAVLQLYTLDGDYIAMPMRDVSGDTDYDTYSTCKWITGQELDESQYILRVNGVDYYIDNHS
ncbi:hypothetical protein SAMN05216349_12219 [Oribacterium sp. KHPX15]|uniref:hypothetical protein n=1 Tax=Oribacterium sp. KHPX15 TaxID=1855342 RepID=UPI000896ABA8|nr:hypothetical protein [Oribacterium sp. KHPX15]SEA67564.1 hypothetical protein SAMN05216349_12219 [Oribacterium sp. KHPX15]